MKNNMDKDFHYFLDNREKLLSEYLGRFVIIKDQKVVKDFSTEIEAYEFGKNRFGLGSFLIQHCIPDEDSITNTFHSRVGST